MNFVFGPVPSRRLGRSLGVDLVPFKTCSYDCLYCQLGVTTNKTVKRCPWVDISKVLAELEKKLSSCSPDYITLSGSGEPTLHSQLGELVDGIKAVTDVPVAVLTNGSMLHDPAVRKGLLKTDLAVPSLDAGDEKTFRAVNRPHESLTFEQMLDGLIEFRREYGGEYWLEVFILGGYTDTDEQVRRIAECVGRIRPDKVQLNTVTRPPAEQSARPVDRSRLEKCLPFFDVPAEIIADFHDVHKQAEFVSGGDAVLEMLRRRPCTVQDIAAGLGMHLNEAIKYVEELTSQKKISKTSTAGKIYFTAK